MSSIPYTLKRAVLLAASSALLCQGALAATLNTQQLKTLENLKKDALNSDTSYQIIESLTTEVGARMVGTEAEKKSVTWAVNKMKALGFDKVWTEPVATPKWHRGEARVSIESPYPHTLVALALGGSVGTDGKTLKAPVVQFENLQALKDAKADSLKGKIAFVSYRMERHIDGHGYGMAVGARGAGAAIAAEKGAIAYVMRSVGTDTNRVAHTGGMRYQDGVKKIPGLALSNPDADLLLNQLKRNKPVIMSLSLTANPEPDAEVTSYNVIGQINGSELPNEYVTLGAHLDSWDVGTGAIDDGIGVGMTLAAVHHIAQLPQRPKRSVRVILFAAEEIGLFGARAYAKAHKDDMKDHVIGAEWDFGNGDIYQLTPGVGPSALNNIRDLATLLAPMGVSLSSENNAKGQSDMSALGRAGMPAINFDPDGSDYFDYHHTPNDTLDKVNRDALKKNTAIYTMFSYFAAQSDVDFRK
ncbi:M20/M25/M40 family metallo-hydrolase [Neptunicella marina]|uniref:Carboxypeptidase Q n=1 Tax=Neptunicella marina TaxID=2125989 RepID=A0A8J6IR00_9ALTE|nr:M20/M25/M40 family metallo-hydrolase [Neptunicella marina]MBC3764869.1 M20/M25/M40 family metallo-hydrolase [Neptunicella marina]